MNQLTKEVIHAVSTVFFQEGFNRENEEVMESNLNYWAYPRQSKIRSYWRDEEEYRWLAISTKNIDDKWYLELWQQYTDEYGDDQERDIIVYIPIKPTRLCWEMDRYCERIEQVLETIY